MNDDLFKVVIILIIGIVFLVIYFYLKSKGNRLLSTGIPVEGIVFGFETSTSDVSNYGNNKYPIIRFVTLKKDWITEAYNIAYPTFLIKAGQKVEVFYNSDNPKDFIIKTKFDKWVLLTLLVVGTVLIFTGLVFLYLDFK